MKNTKSFKKIWLFLTAACVLIVIASLVLAFVLRNKATSDQNLTRSGALYWNVDRADFQSGIKRTPNGNGNYVVTFSSQGESQRIEVSSEVYANGIDMHEIVSLVFDENGVAVDYLTVPECTGGFFVSGFYVEQIDGDTVVCNSSAIYKGYRKSFEVTEDTQVYYAGGSGVLVGIPTQISVSDEIIAVMDTLGNITHVYVKPLEELPNLYWNVTRMFDSATKSTTRELSVGGYEFEMVHNGELITVKARDLKMASSIDAIGSQIMALSFDEEGYVSECIEGGKAANGYFASWYHVQNVTDGRINAVRVIQSNRGKTATAQMARDYVAYDVSGQGNVMGEVTELRPGDLITSLYNSRGEVCITFVIARKSGTQMYWNVERKRDSATGKSTRTPDANGWYHILLAVNGKQVTYKTKDRALVDSIDGRADKHFGLEIVDGIITKYFDPTTVYGGAVFGSWYDVTAISDDGVVTVERMSGSAKGTVLSSKMHEDCKIYNVSPTAQTVGQETTLQVGDRICGELDYNGEICIIYTVERLVESRIYWNVDRKWDSAKGVSTRMPAEDGYYYILLAVDGKQVTYKTKEQAIVNSIDGKADKHFGLKVRGDEIVKYYTPKQVTGGGVFGSWYDVTKYEDGELTVTRTINPNKGKVQSARLAEKCNIFDVSTAANTVGELTSLRIGDRICGVTNARGEVVTIFVVDNRYVDDAEFYWNLERQWDSTTGTTKRTPAADGWYYIKLATGGRQVTLKTQDYSIANAIDAKVDSYFGLTVEGDVIIRYCDPKMVVGGGVFGSWYDVTDLSDGKVTVKRTVGGSNQGKEQTAPLAPDYEVFNVSTAYNDFKGEKTSLRIGDRIVGHRDKNGKLVIAYVVERKDIPAEPDHFHCLCNGTVTGHSCDENTGWSAWTSSVRLPTSSGFYYLTKDIDLSSITAAMSIDAELHICLNGHTITGPTAKVAMWYVKGYLSISDCCGDGSVVTQSAQNGAAIHIFNKDRSGKFELYGGTLKAGGQSSACGLIFVGNNTSQTLPAYFNMYGGTLTGGNVTGNAGAVSLLTENAVFNMYGGSISGNAAKGNGSAVYVSANTAFNMYAGTVTGNTAANGAVYVLGTFKVAGAAKVSGNTGGNVYLPEGKTVTCADVTANASIGITMATNGVFTTLVDLKLKSVFVSDDGISISSLPDGRLLLVSGHAHCVCGGTVSGHNCDSVVSWTAWESTNILPTTSGYYYLTADVDLSARTAAYSMGTNVKLQLCLNGHTIKGPTAKTAIWYVKNYFSISDCVGGGTVLTQSTQNGAAIHIFNKERSGKFELYGGTLKASGQSNACGLIFVGNNTSQTLPAYFNMYGGTLTGGNVTGNAGAVSLLTKNAVFNMYGGIISGNAAKGKGGAVHIGADSIFNMAGGTITGNTAGTGAVYVIGTLKLSGNARIEGNTGGDIYLDTGSMTCDALKNGARFGITMKSPGTFLTGTVDLTEFFFSNDAAYTISFEESDMALIMM